MLVVDTSAVVGALVAEPPRPRLVERLAADADLHAPHLIDVEVLHVLRRLVARGKLSRDRAEDARQDFADLAIVRYPHFPLLDRMWELRANITPHDAVFIALSEVLGVPLVTADARLAGAPGHRATVEVL
ncbi:MAG: type II toxin-antitoxin system VapC family toxin [Acidobacteria bacterium]|nr:type II toxin-antitoxin system VapC family toxin [Acidobacteriota bacterium]